VAVVASAGLGATATNLDEDIDGFDEEEDTSNDADNWWRKIPGDQTVDRLTNAEILSLGNKVHLSSSLI
jgi:hypothetical protein